MTKLSLSIAPVEFTAQGFTSFADPADFAPVALESIFAYGVRRWVQDHVNAQAHAFRAGQAAGEIDAAETFNAEAVVAARLEAAKTGVLSTPRGNAAPALSEQEEAVYEIAVSVRAKVKPLAAAWNASKGEPTPARKAAMLKAVAALPDETRGKIVAAAEVKVAAMASLNL